LFDFVDNASNNPTFYADLRKPQSLNKYQYSYNNPLRYIDPNGHEPDDPDPQGQCCSGAQRIEVPGPPIRPLTQQEVEDLKAVGRQFNEGLDRAADAIRPYVLKATVSIFSAVITTAQKTGLLPVPPATLPQTGTPAQTSTPGQQQQTQPMPPPIMTKGGKQNQRDSELANKTDAQIRELARDKSLTPRERRRYQKEEKARRFRNKQKRNE
jgi:hypothetical protein